MWISTGRHFNSTLEDTSDACIRDHDLTRPNFFVNGVVQNFGFCLNFNFYSYLLVKVMT
ncbi:hypothetical protein ACE6H2_004357 [Prunus campanulata]